MLLLLGLEPAAGLHTVKVVDQTSARVLHERAQVAKPLLGVLRRDLLGLKRCLKLVQVVG